ncbi:MAG: hypothetical protein JW931_03220 [Methanomicrobiaceae archaeon]|nr:hypothetical protein [Methanomicrobiaceae archaeon]
MEEMPEYQICDKCRKRGTPNMKVCWNCGTPYPGFSIDENVSIYNPEMDQADNEVIEIESVRACELEGMDFCKKLFAYNLLLNGDMVLSFCDCEKCTESLSDLLAFIMEADPEDEVVKEEVKMIDRNEFRFEASAFGFS